MAALSTSDLIGTWRVVRTEIPPPYNPEHEFFHFSPDGLHFQEYPLVPQTWRFRYHITDFGVRLTVRDGEYPRELPLRLDGDLLVMTPREHGYSTWLQRISTSERPSCLRRFYESPVNNRDT
jgi:hypothetical protein